MSCKMASRNDLKLASFDGGGARGFSQLEIMGTIMHRLKWEKYPDEADKVMQAGQEAKLRMSVEEASNTLFTVVQAVYKPGRLAPPNRTKKLRECMEAIMEEKGFPLDLKLMEETQTGRCPSFVVASPSIDAGTRICLRSYPVASQLPSKVTVIEAALATCAALPMFAPVSSGSGYRKKEYIAAGLGATNPIRELINEAHSLFGGGSSVGCILSLGTGHPGIISVSSDGGDVDQQRLRDMMNDCERRAQEVEQQIGRLGIYFRFSVEQGMQNEYPGQAADLSWILSQTESYLADNVTSEKVGAFVQRVHSPINRVPLSQLKYVGGAGASLQSNSTLEVMLAMTTSNHDETVLAKLRPADLDCGSRVAQCMDGTRGGILQTINDWATDFGLPNILWIKGYPGVGKSAISSSLVERLRVSKRLGSSFFFQRERAAVMTPQALWRIVASDLARQYPTIREHLLVALAADETTTTTAIIDKLFRQLIYDPLVASGDIAPEIMPVVVIDALDECGGLDGMNSEDRTNVVRTLESWSRLPGRFKLVVTSRGENDIERLFSTISHHLIEIGAGQGVDSQSSDDVKVFLEAQFRQITARYPKSLPCDWPGNETIMELTKKAAGVFIWAKTVVRFVTGGEPEEQLHEILEGHGISDVGGLYSLILQTSFPDPKENLAKTFRLVLGSIILAKVPLTITSIVHLFSVKRSTLEYICNGLQSVMDSHDILRINHQSFADFLLDKTKCPHNLCIDRNQESRSLTLACLETMRKNLRFNICDLKTSYIRNADVPDLASLIEKNIPPHVSYSCCFWANHLARTAFHNEILDGLQCFMCTQFLYWLEVLSLIKKINLASGILWTLKDWIRTYGQDDALAVDMRRFVSTFASVISQSAPHIYLSALPFSPPSSAVSKQYIGSYPHRLVVGSGGQNNWPAIHHVLLGHNAAVYCVKFSPDGRRIVSASFDKTIRVWDTETGEMITGPFGGHTLIYLVAYSPDGRRIVSVSGDYQIRIWDAETGKMAAGPFKGHGRFTRSVAISPDGRSVVYGTDDNTVCVCDAETGKMVAGPFKGPCSFNCVAISPDGRHIASGSGDTGGQISGSQDKTIQIWNVETGEMILGGFKGHSSIHCVAFSPDGRLVVSASENGELRVWDAKTGKVAVGPLKGINGAVLSVAFSPDSRYVVSGSRDKTVRVWDAKAGVMIKGPFEAHTRAIYSVAYSPDGRRIVSGSDDNTIRVWDADAGEMAFRRFEGHKSTIHCVTFSPDGTRVASAAEDGEIRVWDAETGKMATKPFKRYNSPILSLAFSRDARRIVSGSRDKTIRVWNAETGEMVKGPFEPHNHAIYSVAYSPDGRHIVSGSEDTTVRVSDAETGRMVAWPLERHCGAICVVSFSPEEKCILSGARDNTIAIWNPETGKRVSRPFQGYDGVVCCVAFSPDGKSAVSGSGDGTVRVWDVDTGEMAAGPFQGHTGTIYSVGFSLDNRRIVSGSRDNTIRVWNSGTGRTVIGPLRGHNGSVHSVTFSPDGRRVASGSGDSMIRVWNTEKTAFFNQN